MLNNSQKVLDMELVSIIMSVYNEPAEYISCAIESILNQTYRNLEIIIILDNPDNIAVEDKIKEYAESDERIIFIVNEYNMGLTSCLNKALLYANGTYIARMDADDISDKMRIDEELNYLKRNNLDLVGCQVKRIDSKGNVVEKCTNLSYPPDCIKKTLIYDNCIAHPTWLTKKDVYKALNGYRDARACEDYDFLLRALRKGYSLGICDKTLFSYRINENGISRKNRFRQFLSSVYLRRNFDRLEEIKMKEIEEYVNHVSTGAKAERYAKGKNWLDKAVKCLKNRNLKFAFYIMLAIFVSKYTWINLYYITRIKLVRRKYKRW